MGTNHRSTNHKPDRPSQNSTAQSGAWEARQETKSLQKSKTLDKQSFFKENTGEQAELQ